MIKRLVFVGIVCVCSGCSWIFHPAKPKTAVSLNTISVQVLRADLLARAGAVAVEPFKAGSEAAATPELDRFSLLMVKGAIDALENEGGALRYKGADRAENADLVLDGHIDQFRMPGIADRVRLNARATVAVRGELRDLRSGEIVALIYDRRKVAKDRKSQELSAYALGVDLVRGLLNERSKL